MPESLRCKLDGGEGVLDLVREPSRHLAPGGVSLRLDELGDVIEHDHVSLAARQRCSTAYENPSTPGRGDADFVATVAQAVCRGLLEPLEQPVHQGVQLRVQVGEGFERPANHFVEIDAENFRGRTVGSDEPALAVQRQHSGGQSPEHRFEVSALRLDEKLAGTRLVMRPLELAGHLVERGDKESDLVLGRPRELRFVVSAGDRLGPLRQILQRRDHAPRRPERGVHGGEQTDEQDNRQGEGKAQLQGFAKIRQLPILGRRGLHAVSESVHSLRHGKERLQQPRLDGRLVRRNGHHDLHVQPAVPDFIQPDVVTGSPRLRHDPVARTDRNHGGGIHVARTDDVPVRTDERELRRSAQAAGIVERADCLLVVQRFEVRRDSRGLREEFAHAHSERGAAEFERIVQGRFDPHVEPTVDPTVQKLEREVVDDGDRRHRQDHEDDHHPYRELGSGAPFSCLMEQVIQVPGNEDTEADQRYGIDREQN